MTKEAGISVIPTLVAFRNIVRQATDVREYLKDPNLAYMAPSMREKLEPARQHVREPVSARGDRRSRGQLRVPAPARQGAARGRSADSRRDGRVLARCAGILPARRDRDLPGPRIHALRGAQDRDGRSGPAPREGGRVRNDRAGPAGRPDPDAARTRSRTSRRLRSPEGVMARGALDSGAGAEAPAAAISGVLPQDDGRARAGRGVGSSRPSTRTSGPTTRSARSVAPSSPRSRPRAGRQALTAMLEGIRKSDPQSPLVREEAVNELGYALVGRKQTEAAIAVFRLNTEIYPRSGNTWDSLAETYLATRPDGARPAALRESPRGRARLSERESRSRDRHGGARTLIPELSRRPGAAGAGRTPSREAGRTRRGRGPARRRARRRDDARRARDR